MRRPYPGRRFAVGSAGRDAVYLYQAATGELLETLRWPRVLAPDFAVYGSFGDRMAVSERSLLVLASQEADFPDVNPGGVLYLFPR